ncbi:hypothetical protein [Olleya sp. HaHaR_3_96]|uniref:hypothetical protein n=1 Tax=Olleya sp. HaHaR_3_96 TaxID=2745560 RepID=UPI001C4FA2FA|nr:hypothetical protein [Olleya sp. HaHaR_3_96]QXP58455.1 hypothetical protein H0I26_11040 [Olleya sp. HaHaR_3_96]
MKKKILLIFIISIALSCNSNKNKEKVEQLEQQLEIQKNKKDSLLQINRSLTIEKKELAKKKEDKEENYVKEENIRHLLEEDSWITIDNKKLLSFVFEDLNLEKRDLETAIRTSWIFYPAYGEYPFWSEDYFANHMISKINRSTESLEKMLTTEIKALAYSIFKQNNLYKNCGAYSIVKSLLLSYEGFKNEKEPLAQIYQIASKSRKQDDAITPIIMSMATKEILDALSDLNYTTYKKYSFTRQETRLVTIYTFWARRYNEGNLEFTYSILKELHQNMTNEDVVINSDQITDDYNQIQ